MCRCASLTDGDAEAVLAIYEEGIATGNATFETVVPPWPDWDATHLAEHRFVACTDNQVVGWAALSPVSDRCVYAGVAENSVYVAAQARGCGVGRRTSRDTGSRLGSGGDLDAPDRHLSGEHRQHPTAPVVRLPCGGTP